MGGALQLVAQLGFFGGQVVAIVFAGFDADGDFFYDREAVAFDAVNFFGVVGHDADFSQAEIAEDLAADAVVAFVDGEAESLVGFDGVVAFFLEGVGVELVGEADAAAFLAEVDEGAFAFLFDHLHGGGELGAAIAAGAAEDVAGEAFAVDSDEDGLFVDDHFSILV